MKQTALCSLDAAHQCSARLVHVTMDNSLIQASDSAFHGIYLEYQNRSFEVDFVPTDQRFVSIRGSLMPFKRRKETPVLDVLERY